MRQEYGGRSFLKKAVIICIISVAVFSLHFMSLKKLSYALDDDRVVGAAPSNTTFRDSNETAAAVPFDGRDTSLFPANPTIYFIHVGKTGGITLQTIFRTIPKSATIRCRMKNSTAYDGKEEKDDGVHDSNNLCYQPQANESQLSRHVLTHFHMQNPGAPNRTVDENQWILNHTNMFLFSVRDPINRMISMYNYHRNMNYEILARQGGKVRVRPNSVFFFKQCFDDENGLDEVLNTLKNQSAKELTEKCKRIGLEVLLGRNFKGGAHFKLGYRYYKKFTIDAYPTTHAVAVIRMEHMFDDLSQLDRAVGGTGTLQKVRYTHGSERYHFPYISYLSPSNTFTLCCLIYEELEAYQTIILKAINLDDTQKRKTLSNLMNHCQIQSGGEMEEQDSFSWDMLRHGSRCNSSLSSMIDIIDDVEGKKIVYN